MLMVFQVPKPTALVLEAEGYKIEGRGLISVKGKGEMETWVNIILSE